MTNPLLRHTLIFVVLLLMENTSASPYRAENPTYAYSGYRLDSLSGMHLFLPSNFMDSIRVDHIHLARIRTYREGYLKAVDCQDYPRALTYCDSLIKTAENLRIPGHLFLTAYRDRANLLKALHREADACDAYILAIRKQDKLIQRSKNEAVRDMQTAYELDRMALGQALLKARHHKAALTSLLVLLTVVLCAVAFFYISNRRTKKLQRMLLRKIAQSRDSEGQKTAFINSMCHEIRTPLNCITGFSELLCSGEITQDIHAQYHNIIQQSRHQLRYAFNDMLDVAYLENLSAPLPRNYTDLTALCRMQLRTMQVKHPKPGVAFISDIPNSDIGINTNEKYLSVLIFELLGNALKFTDSGSIRLCCSTYETDKVTISITDTGCGIPAEQREHVFERFTKLDTFRQGNGLGLYLCKLIVRHLYGTIQIDPEYTSGTRVVVVLPRK